MATDKVVVPWDDVRVLMSLGNTRNQTAEKLGITHQALGRQIEKFHPDLKDLSKVPVEVFLRWNAPLPKGMEIPDFKAVGGTDLTWEDIKEYLSLGLLIEETAAAAGLDTEGLQEAYKRERPSVYDTIETWAMVLRARRNYELIKAIEKRAMDGDLRAAVVVSKMRAQRFPKDGPPPLTNIKGLL